MLSAAESSLSASVAYLLLCPTHLACRSKTFALVYLYALVQTAGSNFAASVAVNSFFATASSNVLAVCFVATVVATGERISSTKRRIATSIEALYRFNNLR